MLSGNERQNGADRFYGRCGDDDEGDDESCMQEERAERCKDATAILVIQLSTTSNGADCREE